MEIADKAEEYQENYDESSFWDKILKFAKRAGIEVIYLALLLYYTLCSNTLSLKDKAIVYGALGYFILPIDLIPDYIPVIGLSDDFGVLIHAYNIIKDNINDDIRGKAKKKLSSLFKDINFEAIDKF